MQGQAGYDTNGTLSKVSARMHAEDCLTAESGFQL